MLLDVNHSQRILLHKVRLLLLGKSNVNRRRLQVLVSQDFLQRQNVGAHFVVVGGHGVPQGVFTPLSPW